MATPAGVNPSIHRWKIGDPLRADWLDQQSAAIERLSQAGLASGANLTLNGAGVFSQPYEPDLGFLFWNGDESETVPAYGVCLTDGIVSNGPNSIPKAKLPDTYGCQNNFIVNGVEEVDPTSPGSAQPGPFYRCAYNPGDGVPLKGEMWGPLVDEFALRKDVGGFIALGYYDTDDNVAWFKSMPMISFVGKIPHSMSIAQGTSGTVEIYTDATVGGETDSGYMMGGVYSRFKSMDQDEWVRCEWNPDSEGWEIIGPAGGGGSSIETGTPTAIILAGSSGTFTVGAGSRTATVPFGICVTSSAYQIGQDKAGNWYVLNPHLTCFARVSTTYAAPGSISGTIYTGTLGSETSSGVSITAYLRNGGMVTGKTYTLTFTTGGWVVADPELTMLCQFAVVGSTKAFVAGNTATATIYSGTMGSETSTGVTATAYIRKGICVASGGDPVALIGSIYTLAWIVDHWEVTDPELTFFGQLVSSTPALFPNPVSFTIYTGTVDTEVTTNVTVTANIRYGLCQPAKTYRICECNGKREFEVEDPDYECFGQSLTDIPADTTGTLVVYTGAGAGTASAAAITPVRNDSSCPVKANKIAGAKFRKAGSVWVFDYFHVS